MLLRSDVRSSEVHSADGRLRLTEYLRLHPAEVLEVRRSSGRIPVAVYRRYADWVLGRLRTEPLEDLVVHLAERPGGFLARTAGGREIAARRVVLATGIEGHRRLPESLARLPAGRVVHSYDACRVEGIAGADVTVVGGGQSGAEAVAHLAPKNRVTWLIRSAPVFFSEPVNLPPTAFRSVLKASVLFGWMPRPLRRVLGHAFVASTITPDLRHSVSSRRVLVRRGDADDVDWDRTKGPVVACTGYRYRMDSLSWIDRALSVRIELLEGGCPRLDRGFRTSVAGLHVVGGLAEASLGPSQRFLFGGRQAVRAVVRALA
jgi:hypothetical protein